MRRHTIASAAIVLALTLPAAGCGGEEPASDGDTITVGTSTSSPTPPTARTYATPRALSEAIAAAGLRCVDYAEIDGAVGALARGTCKGTTGEITLSTYANEAQARADLASHVEIMRGVSDIYRVVGPNWLVGTNTEREARSIAAAIGGDVAAEPQTGQ